jgi:serine/threonine protein kinase
VDPAGCARITDIGLVMVRQSQVSIQSVPEDFQHHVYWAAPEILNSPGAYSKAADVFSFAGVMIEVCHGEPTWSRHRPDVFSTKAVTGAAPFGNNPYAAVLAIARGERPPKPTNPILTDRLWLLMQRCWDQKAHQRPSASEILASL